MHSQHSSFLECIESKNKVEIEYFSKKDDQNVTRICAPMDFGPSRRGNDQTNKYHFWDYEGSSGPHPVSLLADQIVNMQALDEAFDPAEFVTWLPNWHFSRDWGQYS